MHIHEGSSLDTGLGGCAEVGIGLDLHALGTPEGSPGDSGRKEREGRAKGE